MSAIIMVVAVLVFIAGIGGLLLFLHDRQKRKQAIKKMKRSDSRIHKS